MSEPLVVASVLLRSRTGRSVRTEPRALSLSTIDEFRPPAPDVDRVVERLTRDGFTIEAVTEVGVSFSGSAEQFAAQFGAAVRLREVELPNRGQSQRRLAFFEAAQPLATASLDPFAEQVRLAVPAVPLHGHVQPTPAPPYYWLDAVSGVPARLNLAPVHAAGITGQGVRVSVIDTGFVTRVTETHVSGDATHVVVDHPVRDVRGVWLGSDPGHTGTNFYPGGSYAGSLLTLGHALPAGQVCVQVVYSCLHPHYTSQGYAIGEVRAVAGFDANADEYGHGTAEAANILAVAPGALLSLVKDSDGYQSAPLAAFQGAVQHQRPDVISCSWGTVGVDAGLELEIVNAVANGIVVVFAAGNGQTDNPQAMVNPVTHPNLISVGGAYPIQGGGFRATRYASSFDSFRYTNPQRHIPDVTGLVGEPPRAALIMLPTQPGDSMDTSFAGAAYPNGDNTARDDGWVACSGTSAAAPQVAGLAALLRQRYPGITPMGVKNVLENSALDVTTGLSAQGDVAAPGWDAATGFGVVDGAAAVNYLVAGQFNAYVRDSVEDSGREPVVADRLYASPDIIVRNEPVTDPQLELGQTVKHRADLSDQVEDGQDNYVYVRVQNRGRSAGSASVTVYFTDPGMFGSSAAWRRIGQLPVTDLAPGEFRVAGPITWLDADVPAPGHYCLISVLDSTADPAPDLTAIHTLDDFVAMVRDCNNVAWKNIDIVDLVPGGTSSYSFYLQSPPAGHVATVEIDTSAFLPGAQVMVRVLRRIADHATLSRLVIGRLSYLYSYLVHQGGAGQLRGVALKSDEVVKATVYYSAPPGAPDGTYPVVARLLADGVPVAAYTHVVKVATTRFIGNRRTGELHLRACPWVARMAPHNKAAVISVEDGTSRGYDNCAICLGGSMR